MGGMLTVPRMGRNLSFIKSGSLKPLVFIFIYNSIHKLIKLQFKTSYVSWSHSLYIGFASWSSVDMDVKSHFLLLWKTGFFSKTPRMVWEILLSYMQLVKPEAGFIARTENTVKMQWMKAYVSTLYLQVHLKNEYQQALWTVTYLPCLHCFQTALSISSWAGLCGESCTKIHIFTQSEKLVYSSLAKMCKNQLKAILCGHSWFIFFFNVKISVDSSGNTALGSFNVCKCLSYPESKLIGVVKQSLNNILWWLSWWNDHSVWKWCCPGVGCTLRVSCPCSSTAQPCDLEKDDLFFCACFYTYKKTFWAKCFESNRYCPEIPQKNWANLVSRMEWSQALFGNIEVGQHW